MKIIEVHIDKATQAIGTTLFADSALLNNGKPLFLPDIAKEFALKPMLAMRIGRLGKRIGRRFAYRYVDAISPSFITTPVDSNIADHTVMQTFDGAITVGEWVNFTPTGPYHPLPGIEWTLNGQSCASIDGNAIAPLWYDALVHLSQFATVRMGDIVCLGIPDTKPVPVKINDRVEASIKGKTQLKTKIK